jgi:molybdopterin-synthase adenylyltransferase
LKIMVGSDNLNRDLLFLDVWDSKFMHFKISRRPGCPACGGNYEFLSGQSGLKTTSLCGQNAVQVLSTQSNQVSFQPLAQRLSALGKVSNNEFMLTFNDGSHEMIVFPDGRAIVKDTVDEALARSLYAKYIGA